MTSLSALFKDFNAILDNYSKYIIAKNNKIQQQKKNDMKSRSSRVGSVLLSSVSSSSQISQKTQFKTLKSYIDIKVPSRTRNLIFSNEQVVKLLNDKEYAKSDIEHQLALPVELRMKINEMFEQEKEEIVRHKMEEQRREIEKKEQMVAAIPRFQIGMPLFDSHWNSFIYDHNDGTYSDITMIYTTIGDIFSDVFTSLIDSINNETIVRFTEPADVIPEKRFLEKEPRYRQLIFYLGYLFNEPFFEKEFNEYISHYCHIRWWFNYLEVDKINDEEFIVSNRCRVCEMADKHFKERFWPTFQKIIIKHKNIGFNDYSAINKFLYVFLTHEQDETIDKFKHFKIMMNNVFSDYYGRIYNRFKAANEIKQTIEPTAIVSQSSNDQEEGVDFLYDSKYMNDFFNGEKLLLWFVDTNVSEDLIFSRYTAVYLYENGSMTKKTIICHLDRRFENYQKYNMFLDYISNEKVLKRIIPSTSLSFNKPPMMNLSAYLSTFFYSVMINPYAYENTNESKLSIMYENLFIVLYYLLSANRIKNDLWSDIVELNEYQYTEYTRFLMEHVIEVFMNESVEISSKSSIERIILYIIFDNVCKRCYFSTCQLLIDIFLKKTQSELYDIFIEKISKNRLLMEKKKSLSDHPIFVFLGSSKKTASDGIRAFVSIIRHIFFNISKSSSVKFFVSLRLLQDMVEKHFLRQAPSSSLSTRVVGEKQIKEKMDDDLSKLLILFLKNRKMQQLLSYDEHDFIVVLMNISCENVQQIVMNFGDEKSRLLLEPLISHLLGHLFVFFNNTSNIQRLAQEVILNYISTFVIKALGKIPDESISEKMFVSIIKRNVCENQHFIGFLREICLYYNDLNEKNIKRINEKIYLLLTKAFEKKVFHEVACVMILIKICYDIDNPSNEIALKIKKFIHDKQIMVQDEEKNKKNTLLIFKHVGRLNTDIISADIVSKTNSAAFFDNYTLNDIESCFDVLNIFTQISILFTHHFNWIKIAQSMNHVYLSKINSGETITIDLVSYYDVNETSSEHINISKYDVNIKHIEECMFIVFSIEKLLIEKTERKARIFSSLDHLYNAAHDCRTILQSDGPIKFNVISHTPESKMISTLFEFVKIKILRLYMIAMDQSNYPEDAFVVLLSNEKQKTIEIIQSVLNLIVSVFSRVKMAATLTDQTYIQTEQDENNKRVMLSEDAILNPIKYQIQDSLLNHAFYIRMMQKHIKNKDELGRYAWFALPCKLTQQLISTGSDSKKVIALLQENRVDERWFKKTTNPKNYLAWRMWFSSLVFVNNAILLTENRPYNGRVYYINQLLPTMPAQPSDSLVLNRSNISESSLSSSSSSTC